ncbi:MAG: hypothetical protein DDT31_00695 [Syntrophomonadaceae bacterium]|nr:hypothetical protein [Bacillota bacterium]
MLISELLLEKNDILPDEVLVQLIGPFIRDYIDAMPNDVKESWQFITAHYGKNTRFGLRITVHFSHYTDLKLLSKQATRKIEDKYDMVGDWKYEKRTLGGRLGLALDFTYKHEIDISQQVLEAGLKKTFSDYIIFH